MYGLGGMWFFSLILVVPLLIGVASASKRLYQFLVERGFSRNNALTASVVGLLMLVGIMTSPLFLGALPLRAVAGLSYLYFLFTGGRTIVNFFTGGNEAAKEAKSEPRAQRDEPVNKSEPDAEPAPEVEPAPARPATPPAKPARTAAELRAELERRIADSEGKGDKDAK